MQHNIGRECYEHLGDPDEVDATVAEIEAGTYNLVGFYQMLGQQHMQLPTDVSCEPLQQQFRLHLSRNNESLKRAQARSRLDF